MTSAKNSHKMEAVQSHGGVRPYRKWSGRLPGRLPHVMVSGSSGWSRWRGGGYHLWARVGDSDDGGVAFLLKSILWLRWVGRTDDDPGGGVAGRVDDEGLLVRQHHVRRRVGLLTWWSLARRSNLRPRLLPLLIWYTGLLAEVPRLKLLQRK